MHTALTTHKIFIPIYNANIILIEAQTIKDAATFIESANGINLPDLKDVTAFSADVNDVIYVVIQRNGLISDLVHELNHVTYTILDYAGVDISDQEAFCYLQQFIFEQICTILSIPMDLSRVRLKAEDMQ